MKCFLEAGKIVNTHGVRGEVKIQPWCDGPEFLAALPALYIEERRYELLSARTHKGCVLARLSGVDSIEAAMALKGTVVFLNREEASLPEGSYFIADILGWPVYDRRMNRNIGVLKEVLELPASQIYVVTSEKDEDILIPAVPEFVRRVDFEMRRIEVETIPGMGEEA